MHISLISLFPEWVLSVGQCGIVGRAVQSGLLELDAINPRDFTEDVHRTVDDRPYGGGPGMVMKYQPLRRAIDQAKSQNPSAMVVYMSPQGQPLQQSMLQQWAQVRTPLILLAGRYEGIDERLIESSVDVECSIGDYVLSGGELAAMVVVDGIARLLPGALGHRESAVQDSFSDQLLDCPHYTRPEKLGDASVPSTLLSGDHRAIARWRRKQSLGRTWQRRPDLLAELSLSLEDERLLQEFQSECATR